MFIIYDKELVSCNRSLVSSQGQVNGHYQQLLKKYFTTKNCLKNTLLPTTVEKILYYQQLLKKYFTE